MAELLIFGTPVILIAGALVGLNVLWWWTKRA